MVNIKEHNIQYAWRLLAMVKDPEVPVLNILDLGIVRDVALEAGVLTVTITPTYSGCPAMDVIGINIKLILAENGFKQVMVKQTLQPAWTTDWMTQEGKDKLTKYGIAPPQYKTHHKPYKEVVPCPLCNSTNTVIVSYFGSTACKAQYTCKDCLEPFDYFKCH
jgi:ring-1,2-phenylacetyl-CoA epoxidase subunit PaaD